MAVAHGPALDGGYVWDDDEYVWNNPNLGSVAGLRSIWLEPLSSPQYYPLVFTTFWLEYRLWGAHPGGYHAVNVALHAANAVLLYLLLRRLAVPGALLAAALFGAHPVHVESVAWVSERKNVLSALCYLGAALSWVTYAEGRRRIGAYTLGIALYVAALLSKTVTASLPVALLLLAWWRRRPPLKEAALQLTPFFAVGVPLGLVTVWIERHHVGALGAAWSLSLAERLLVAGRAVAFYLGKLAWPDPLMFFYPRWRLDTGDPRQVVFPLLVAGVLAGLFLARARLGRAPLVAALFFVVTLFPALGLLNTWPMAVSFVADHFQYLASIGPLALAGAGGSLLAARLRRRLHAARLGTAAAVVVVAALGMRARQQAALYRDDELLYRTTVALNPGAWAAWNFLGAIRSGEGRVEEAVRDYRQGIRHGPAGTAERHLELGRALRLEGRRAAAEALLRAVVAEEPSNAEAHRELGEVLLLEGRAEEAASFFREALRLAPKQAGARRRPTEGSAAQRQPLP